MGNTINGWGFLVVVCFFVVVIVRGFFFLLSNIILRKSVIRCSDLPKLAHCIHLVQTEYWIVKMELNSQSSKIYTR